MVICCSCSQERILVCPPCCLGDQAQMLRTARAVLGHPHCRAPPRPAQGACISPSAPPGIRDATGQLIPLELLIQTPGVSSISEGLRFSEDWEAAGIRSL